MNKAIASIALSLAASLGVNAHTKEILSIEGSEGQLYAELQKPATEAEKLPLVIICHGFTGNCNTELMTDVANDLQSQGIASLRFDFNGHGKSEGEFQNMTVLNEIEDLKDVILWAQSQPWVENISLLGHSQGGVVVSMTAGELGDNVIKNVVLMAPAAVLRDDAIRGKEPSMIPGISRGIMWNYPGVDINLDANILNPRLIFPYMKRRGDTPVQCL